MAALVFNSKTIKQVDNITHDGAPKSLLASDYLRNGLYKDSEGTLWAPFLGYNSSTDTILLQAWNYTKSGGIWNLKQEKSFTGVEYRDSRILLAWDSLVCNENKIHSGILINVSGSWTLEYNQYTLAGWNTVRIELQAANPPVGGVNEQVIAMSMNGFTRSDGNTRLLIFVNIRKPGSYAGDRYWFYEINVSPAIELSVVDSRELANIPTGETGAAGVCFFANTDGITPISDDPDLYMVYVRDTYSFLSPGNLNYWWKTRVNGIWEADILFYSTPTLEASTSGTVYQDLAMFLVEDLWFSVTNLTQEFANQYGMTLKRVVSTGVTTKLEDAWVDDIDINIAAQGLSYHRSKDTIYMIFRDFRVGVQTTLKTYSMITQEWSDEITVLPSLLTNFCGTSLLLDDNTIRLLAIDWLEYETLYYIYCSIIGSASIGKHTASVGKTSNKYGR